jgi:hypothetical protein
MRSRCAIWLGSVDQATCPVGTPRAYADRAGTSTPTLRRM